MINGSPRRGVTLRPEWISSWRGRMGCSRRCRPAGDDATWFPNLYDDLEWIGPDKEHGGQVTRFQTPSPLLKYDQLFGTSARQWEAAFSQNKDISRWPGHCLGGAVASILLNEPAPAPGSGLTRDELKALWAELGENHYNHRIGDYANEIPPGPPRRGYDVDRLEGAAGARHAGNAHSRREKAAARPTCGRSRPAARSTRCGTTEFTSTSRPTRRSPAADRVRSISRSSSTPIRARCSTARTTRTGSSTTSTTWSTALTARSTRPTRWPPTGSRWEAKLSMLRLNVLELVESRWGGHNQQVTEANVRSIDMANGGTDRRRLAGSPPIFRPVGQYEAGRPQMFADSEMERADPSVRRIPSRVLRTVTGCTARAQARWFASLRSPLPRCYRRGPTRRLASASDSGPGLAVSGRRRAGDR